MSSGVSEDVMEISDRFPEEQVQTPGGQTSFSAPKALDSVSLACIGPALPEQTPEADKTTKIAQKYIVNRRNARSSLVYCEVGHFLMSAGFRSTYWLFTAENQLAISSGGSQMFIKNVIYSQNKNLKSILCLRSYFFVRLSMTPEIYLKFGCSISLK